MLDFTRRNHRWFYGNLKNLKLLRQLSMTTMDRYHLVGVAHRFIAWPAVVVFIVLGVFTVSSWPAGAAVPIGPLLALYVGYFVLYFTPRILGVIDALISSPKSYGGPMRLIAGAVVEFVLTILFVPIAMIAATYFIAGAMLGRRPSMDVQQRAAYRLTLAAASRALWPQAAFGTVLLVVLAVFAPGAIPWFLPFLAGPILAIPFALLTSSPRLLAWADRLKLCAIPEEIETPSVIADVLHVPSRGQ